MVSALVLCLCFSLSLTPLAEPLARVQIRLERWLDRLARHRGTCIVLAGVLPVLLRLALLPWFPAPLPAVPDEFAHLLVGQTFAEGRATNVPHLLWPHFESVFILQQPSYTGLYQAGYGAILAVGRLLAGHPWAGVLLTQALALSAVSWLLYLWLPRRWAVVGTSLAVAQVGVGSIWSNSYLAIPVTALGGCLLLGSVRLLRDRVRATHVVMGAAGLAILMHTRPYDGLLLSIVFGAALLRQARHHWRTMLLPLTAVLLPALLLVGWYNSRVTGSPFKLPYLAAREQYGVPQSFFWQPAVPHREFRHAEMRQVYEAQVAMHENRRAPADLAANYIARLMIVWRDYFHLGWLLPLACLPSAAIRRRRTRLLGIAVLLVLIGQSLYFYFASHYLAPLYGALLILLVQALRTLRHWRWRGRPSGAALALYTVVAVWASAFLPLAGLPLAAVAPPPLRRLIPTVDQSWFHNQKRSAISARLDASPRPQLVVVRYSPGHQVLNEYVYNEPRIDSARIVWARDMGDTANAELLHYFAGRQVWLLEPDVEPFRLTTYPASAEIKQQ